MNIDTQKIKKVIYSGRQTSEIEAFTGMTAQNINKYRRGEINVQRMTIEKAEKFCLYYDSFVKKNEDIEDANTNLKYVQKFNSLSNKKKSLLISRKVDHRAFTDNLDGYSLKQNKDGEFFYTQIHSGVGSGHPVYEFIENSVYIVPYRGYVTTMAGKTIEAIKITQKYVPKWELYREYLNDKENIEKSVPKIFKEDFFIRENFEIQYQRIK